jgi:N-ethylmaleimide reductase
MLANGMAELVAFGQSYLANPGLVERFRNDWPINPPQAKTFYTQGAAGYTDYPAYSESDPDTLLPTDSQPLR